MRSEVKVDVRTTYTMGIFNRNNKEKAGIRLKIVRHAQIHGIKPAERHFGCSKNTVRKWLRNFEEHGTRGLEDKSRAPISCPHKTPKAIEEQVIAKRKEAPCHGPKSLKHYNPFLKLSEGAIYRILKENDLLRKHRKKYQRKNDLREVKAQYMSFSHNQEDVKHLYDIPYYWAQMTALGLPKYEYTIRDVKSGFTAVAFANEYNEQYSEILTELFLKHLRSFGIDLKGVIIQTDNGSEFGAKKRDIMTPGFVNTIVMKYGAEHRYIPPGCCNANADVESFHSTIEKEFFDLESFGSREHFFHKATVYQSFYNFVRPNFSKKGKTPLQIFIEDYPAISTEIMNFPVYDLDTVFRQKMELVEGHYVHKLPEISHCSHCSHC